MADKCTANVQTAAASPSKIGGAVKPARPDAASEGGKAEHKILDGAPLSMKQLKERQDLADSYDGGKKVPQHH